MKKRQIQYNWLAISAVLLLITATYMFIATRTTLWDRDEPRFTRAAVEMIETSNYMVPSFNGTLWADKPVLVYWLMTVSIKIFGNSEFACRFWSALGTSISCLLTFFIGKRLLGLKEGFLAMVILASSTMMLVVGTMATSDGVTLPFTLAAMTVFTYAITSRFRFYHLVIIGILMGFGMLAKGPIGLLPLPVMVITGWFIRKNFIDFTKLSFGIFVSFTIAITIFLAWAIPANNATQGQFLNTFIGRHIMNRAFKPMEHHGGNLLLYLPYYLPVIMGGFFPWTMVLPSAFSALIGNRLAEKKAKVLLLTWIISIVAMMSLAATKLPHYIIFVWPALALCSAAVISAFQKGLLSEQLDLKWIGRGNWFFVPAGLTFGCALIAAPFILKMPQLTIPAVICGTIMLITVFIAATFIYRFRLLTAIKVAISGMAIFCVFYLFGVMPEIENIKVTPAISQAIIKVSQKDIPVATYKFGEPTLNHYLGRNITELPDLNAAAVWITDKPAVLVIPNSEFQKLKQQYADLPARLILSKKGYNYSKGKSIELLALISDQENK